MTVKNFVWAVCVCSSDSKLLDFQLLDYSNWFLKDPGCPVDSNSNFHELKYRLRMTELKKKNWKQMFQHSGVQYHSHM